MATYTSTITIKSPSVSACASRRTHTCHAWAQLSSTHTTDIAVAVFNTVVGFWLPDDGNQYDTSVVAAGEAVGDAETEVVRDDVRDAELQEAKEIHTHKRVQVVCEGHGAGGGQREKAGAHVHIRIFT